MKDGVCSQQNCHNLFLKGDRRNEKQTGKMPGKEISAQVPKCSLYQYPEHTQNQLMGRGKKEGV